MHGVCHFEIPSTDVGKSKEFYSGLFEWKFQAEGDPDYVMFSAPEGPGGGLEKAGPGRGAHVNIYIEVKDIAATLTDAAKLGGKVVKGKTLISEEFGYWAMISDPSGVNIGLWSRK